MLGNRRYLRAMRLLPFTAAADKARLALERQRHQTAPLLCCIEVLSTFSDWRSMNPWMYHGAALNLLESRQVEEHLEAKRRLSQLGRLGRHLKAIQRNRLIKCRPLRK